MKESALRSFTTITILGQEFHLYGTVQNPLFLSTEVATIIQHTNARVMLKTVDEDEKLVNNVYTLGGIQEAWLLTENGLYEVCMLSRKPIAKEMKKEVKKDLINIRLTGGYVESNREEEFVENYFPSLSDETKKSIIVDLQKKNTELEKANKELSVDAELARELMSRKGLLTLKQVSDNIQIGRTTLCFLLRKKKILSKQSGYNEPMYSYIKSGYFTTVVEENERTKHVSIVTLVTAKGLKFVYRLIKKNELLDEFNTTSLQEVATNA